jgi:hypothetical protein
MSVDQPDRSQTTPSQEFQADFDVDVDMERVRWCVDHGIAPFALCAEGGCEAWMLVTDKELQNG